jgi:hypothetical protein
MADVTLPTKAEVQQDTRFRWHRAMNPHFDTLVSVGYIDGCYPVSYGGTISGFASGDGAVAFREGSTKLGYGADLSADTLYLVSSSASDTQDYTVQGIDANGDYATATVTATGTTPVAVSGTWNHAQRLICTSGVDNVGTVYLSTKSGAGVPITLGDQIQCVIGPGDNYAINPLLVVPNHMIVTINSFDFTQDVQQAATIRILCNRQGRWLLNFKLFVGLDDHFLQNFHTPLRFFEGDKIRIEITAGGGASANAAFGMNGNTWDVTNLDPRKEGIGEIFK